MQFDLITKPSLYDLGKMCTDAVRWTKQDSWGTSVENRFFQVVLKISGKAYKNKGSNLIEKEIVDELVTVRLLTLLNYKSVYIRFSKELFGFFFGEIDKKNSFYKDCFSYGSAQWVRNASHDTCWAEGLNLLTFFNHDTEFEIVSAGLAQIENSFKNYRQKETALLNDEFEVVEEWNINTKNRWDFWQSFLINMSKNYHGSTFCIQLTNTSGKTINREIFITFDNEGRGKVFETKLKGKQVTIQLEPLGAENVYTLSPSMKISSVSKDSFQFEEHLGLIILRLLEEGYDIKIS